MPTLLKACLNGARRPDEHPALPVSPAQLAADARAVHAMGADALHLHVKDPDQRVAAVRSWQVLPDFASVNWHEDRADDVAAALLDRGVGVEAGLWHAAAVRAWSSAPVRDACFRVLVELPDGLDEAATGNQSEQLLGMLNSDGLDLGAVLLHGEGSSCWPTLRAAAARGMATRIGLEDTLVLPDGSPAPDNAALVRAAIAVRDQAQG